ncbi:hypothetical protein [Aquitalea aquatilis]|uniref:hypothetical protein n=1 Tax=Aquitalea aquatilis TaxID=1537400 RepID=UPI0010BDE31E|nr:hypothetical protein [Aquitalea aquatilis]
MAKPRKPDPAQPDLMQQNPDSSKQDGDSAEQNPESAQQPPQEAATAGRAEEPPLAPARVRILSDATYWITIPTGTEITRQWYRGQIVANDPDVIAELQANGVHLETLE